MQASVQKKLDRFFAKYEKVNFNKGQIILNPEEPIFSIFNIYNGFVKSYSINDEGLQLTINIYKPYNFFPITEALAERDNSYFFEAVTNVVLSKAPLEKVIKFIKNDNDVLYDLTKRISSGLEGFMVRTQHLIRSNSLQKIASSLVLLALRFGEKTPNNQIKIPLPQTHEDIANLAGISRETVSIEIKKLIDRNIISVKKKVYTINDFEKLKKLSTIYYDDKPLPYSF